MKAIFFILLTLSSGFVGYQYAYQSLVVDFLGFTKPEVKAAPAPPPVVVVAEPPPPPPPPVEKPAPKILAEKPKLMESEEQPKIVATGLGEAKKDPNVFNPPSFPSLAETTQNWAVIPKNVFTRPVPVKLNKDVAFKIGSGEINVKAGVAAVAVGQSDNGMLVIAPSAESPGRSEIAVEDTDIKMAVAQIYEAYKVAQIARLKQQYEANKIAAAKQNDFGKKKVFNTGPVKNDKPTHAADGSYPILLASMKMGQVKEITPQNIKKWGEAQAENIEGKDYWTVVVSYSTKTMFGDFNVDAQARIFGGKVEKWIYMGSGEVVP